MFGSKIVISGHALSAKDIEGTWDLDIETDIGQMIFAALILKQQESGDGWQGEYKPKDRILDDLNFLVSGVEIRDDHLRLTFTWDVDEGRVTAQFNLLPKGNVLTGEARVTQKGVESKYYVNGRRRQ